MPRSKRNTPFQPGHAIGYGLRPVARDPNTNVVTSVACRFCEKFGREEKVGAKRRATQHIKYFTQPFRTENYHQHHLGQHPTRWGEYKSLSAEAKLAFFGTASSNTNIVNGNIPNNPAIPVGADATTASDAAATATAVASAAVIDAMTAARSALAGPQLSATTPPPPDVPSIRFVVDRAIVDNIVADVLFDATTAIASSDGVITLFSGLHPSMADYVVTLTDLPLFHLTRQFVAMGFSAKLASHLIETIANATNIGLASTPQLPTPRSPAKIEAYIRWICALNYQTIADILTDAWTFSLAFERISYRGVAFNDILVRVYVHGTIQQFHLLAIPNQDHFSWQSAFVAVTRVLDSVCSKWRAKLLGFVVDNAEAHASGIRELIDHLKSQMSCKTFEVVSVSNQLDGIVQSGYSRIVNASFENYLCHIVAYVRREIESVEPNKSTCPKFLSSSRLGLVQPLKWLAERKVAILTHFDEKKPSFAPSVSWWIYVTAVSEFLQATEKTFEALATSANGTHRQLSSLRDLFHTLQRLSGCSGPVADEYVKNYQDIDLINFDKFAVRKSSVRSFLTGLGSSVQTLLEGLAPAVAVEVIEAVGVMFLSTIVGLSTLIRQIEENNATSAEICPVIPRDLFTMIRPTFNRLVQAQIERLSASFSPTEIDQIEAEFGQFVEAFHREDSLHRGFQASNFMVNTSLLGEWGPLRVRFKKLYQFCSGIATVSTPATCIDYDVSSISWPTTIFQGTSSTDFIVEGSLHCLQYNRLVSLNNQKYRS